METISLNINGVCRELAVGKNWTLLKTLRDGLRLTGTKCGCETGDCGACMVIIDGVATRSCLVKAVNLEGKTASISTQSSRPLWMPEPYSAVSAFPA